MTTKANALQLMMASKQLGLNPNAVKFGYTWMPSTDNVYVGKDVKTSYVHSLWVGVVMTLLHLPFIFWSILLRPLLLLIGSGTVVFLAVVLARLVGGVSGRASGLDIDQDSFNEVTGKAQSAKIAHMMSGLLGMTPDKVKVADLSDPNWKDEVRGFMEDDPKQ